MFDQKMYTAHEWTENAIQQQRKKNWQQQRLHHTHEREEKNALRNAVHKFDMTLIWRWRDAHH